MNCPKGHGALRRDGDDDLVCVTCGHREVEVASNGSGVPRSPEGYADPFAYIVKAMRNALAELRNDLAASEQSIGTRRAQVKRMEKAMAFLVGGAPKAEKQTRTGPICNTCGKHPASAEHKAHKVAA